MFSYNKVLKYLIVSENPCIMTLHIALLLSIVVENAEVNYVK